MMKEARETQQQQQQQSSAYGATDASRGARSEAKMERRGTGIQEETAAKQYVVESARYLILAVTLGLLGFATAMMPSLFSMLESLENDGEENTTLRGAHFHLPATVSELVSRWSTPEARLFFGFELTGGFALLLSWFPFKLRNASCAPLSGGCHIHGPCGCSVAWATFRQFSVPIGLILVACVPTVAPNMPRYLADLPLLASHALAALLMFGGYFLSEAHVLSLCPPFSCKFETVPFGSREYSMRRSFLLLSLMCFVFFQGLLIPLWMGLTPKDAERRHLMYTAAFFLEVNAGVAMLLGHATIWYYCPERHWHDEPGIASADPILA